jgi:phospholipase/carboxylesterase
MNFQYFQHIYQAGKKAETLLLLHGTGADERDLLPLAQQMGWQGNLLSIRGRVLENGMPRFFKRLGFGVFDLEDLQLRTQELIDYLPVVSAHYKLDLHKIAALGYSNGANLLGSALVTQPGLFTKTVLLRPMIPFEPSKIQKSALGEVLLLNGQIDPTVPGGMPQRWQHILEQFYPGRVQLQLMPGGHSLTTADLQAAAAFLKTDGNT